MKVREIMSAPVTTLDPSDTLAFAEELMTVERVRHLPVVDGDVLVGLVSHRDIAGASISTLNNPDPEEDLAQKRKVDVRRVMHGSLETIGPDADVVRAADVFLAEKIGCLPVVDERLHLMGIVTESDFVRIAREIIAARASLAEAVPARAKKVARPRPKAAAPAKRRASAKPQKRAKPATKARAGAKKTAAARGGTRARATAKKGSRASAHR